MAKKKNDGVNIAANLDSDLRFRVTESYKSIRTNLCFSLIKSGCKTVVISSSLPGEGKSTVAVNIAISLAQMDVRVLLIDCDIRKPKVHRFLSLPSVPGLSNTLSSMNDLGEALHETKYANLDVICSGTTVPNPAELLASEQMNTLLQNLQQKYDYIILDTPPLNVVSDAIPLIKQSDGVVLVVRENRSTSTELKQTVESLQIVDGKIIGLILNDVDTKRKRYSSYHYKYGYGYGYGN